LIEVIADDEPVDLGEMSGSKATVGGLQFLRSLVLNADPLDLGAVTTCLQLFRIPCETHVASRAVAGFELACRDLFAKALNRPVAAYPFFTHAGQNRRGEIASPKAMVKQRQAIVERHGLQTIRLIDSRYYQVDDVITAPRVSRNGASASHSLGRRSWRITDVTWSMAVWSSSSTSASQSGVPTLRIF
jgi:hypothetical protein